MGIDLITRVDTSLGIAAVYDDTDYASLSAAVTAIGSALATLRISTALFPNGATCAVPATLTLEFVGAGTLTITTGQTVTILSDGSAWPIRQIFVNATTGLGTVTFSGNTIHKTNRLSWWGAVASVASDQSVVYQAAASATLSGMKLLLDVDGAIRVDSTVTFLDRRNIQVEGPVPLGYTDLNEPTHKLVWYGADGGTALRIDRVRNSLFRGMAIFGGPSGGANGADTGLFLTQDGAGTNISSSNVFEFCTFHPNSTRSGWKGLKIDNTSQANNEQHIIDHCLFVGGSQAFPNQTGTGIYLGHSNVKHVVIKECFRIGLAKFVDSASGSFRSEYCKGGACLIAYSGIVTDAATIIGEESESDRQILSLTGTTAPVSLIGCRFDDLRGGQAASGTTSVDPVISINSCRVNATGSAFGAQSSFTKDFIRDTVGTSSVAWIGSSVYNGNNSALATPQYLIDAGLNTFSSGFASDAFGFRWLGVSNVVSNVMTRPTSRALIQSVPTNVLELPGYIPAALDSLVLGTGEVEITGLARPNQLAATIVGTPGSTSYLLGVLARDASTNRTLISTLLQSISTANATLSGSNYIKLDWPAVPGATDYIVLQYSGGTWRTIATVTASGTDYETYNITSNPGGAFTYVVPTYNETARIKARGPLHLAPTTFANVGVPTPINGDTRFVSDGTSPSNPLTGGGTGCLAIRQNNAWKGL